MRGKERNVDYAKLNVGANVKVSRGYGKKYFKLQERRKMMREIMKILA